MITSSVVRGRRWLAVLVAGVTIAGSLSMSAAPSQAEAAVPIPDAQFLNCLDTNLGKADGESVTATELATITELYCDSMGIADLTGATYLINVADFYLTGNAITSLDGFVDFAPTVDPVSINLSSNKIADLSPLKDFTGTTVYADGQAWNLAVEVGTATTVHIKGRSGDPITELTPAWVWASLTIAGATITPAEAGVIDLTFSDPDACSAVDCVYSFNGTVSVTASAEFSATPAPTITGTAAIGQTLTAHPVDWTPLQDDWTYQWYRDDTEIAGAVSSTYEVTADDAGWGLKVAVSGVKTGYASPSVSSVAVNIPGHPFTTVTRPEIEGTAKVGNILTAEVSGWAPTPESWNYQWYRNGGVIPGATQSSYALVGSDAGKRITVTVTGIKARYAPTSQTSTATPKVTEGTFQTVVPTITGTVQVGHKLTATAPGWSPTPDHWYYRWFRNNKSISGASKSTYTLVAADAGKRITVRMTGLKTGYTTAVRTSAATTKVAKGQFISSAPTIIGTPEVGHTLKVVISGWSPVPSEIHRQWYRDAKKISKATKDKYKLTKSDLHHSITVRVIGEKSGYVSVTKYALALRILT
jgi:hypothetical protein